MKGFIDELPASIKCLEGTAFLTTDLTQILARECSIIFFNHTSPPASLPNPTKNI